MSSELKWIEIKTKSTGKMKDVRAIIERKIATYRMKEKESTVAGNHRLRRTYRAMAEALINLLLEIT